MAAYIIITRFRTRNSSQLQAYASKRESFLAGHPIRWLANFSGRFEVVEGPGAESVAVLEFPTLAEARAWYTSPVYQEACQHRFRGGDYGVMIVEGIAAPPTK
ncbi:MAG: DUF1330 domain-containing protein [Myxococcaceae bacterium]